MVPLDTVAELTHTPYLEVACLVLAVPVLPSLLFHLLLATVYVFFVVTFDVPVNMTKLTVLVCLPFVFVSTLTSTTNTS